MAHARIQHLGIGPGERVAILGENSIDWVIAFFACLELGAITVPLKLPPLSGAELAAQLALVEPGWCSATRVLMAAAQRATAGSKLPLRSPLRAWTGDGARCGPSRRPASPATRPRPTSPR